MKKMSIKKAVLSLPIAICLFMIGEASIKAQSSSEAKQEQGIKIPKKTLKAYEGKYQMQENSVLKIFLKGDSLKAEGPGYPPLDLIPITNSRFFLKQFGVDIEFGKNDKGIVDKLSFIREDGQSLTAIKLDDKQKD